MNTLVNDDAVAALRTWMTEQALPLWATAGWDAAHGGFVERLGADGTPDRDAPRRTFVQARQIYCYAKAAQFDWHPNAKQIALDGLEKLLKLRGADSENGFPHLTAADGSVLDAKRDTYDLAFVLLAQATLLGLTGDAQIRAEIDRNLLFLDRKLRSTHGGFIEELPPKPPRRQNPQMHLFEAMIALFDATSEPVFQQRAGEFFGLFSANLFDGRSATLGEYYEDDWSNILPARIEPGHLAEWTWLLKGFERITGCPTGRHRSVLMPSLLRFRDASGCLTDEGDRDGNITQTTRKLWPQTELAKAWVAQAEGGEEGAAVEARQALARLQALYLNHPVRGGWHAQFDSDGRSTIDTIPASALYHIFCALSEAHQVLP